ncbi:MAG: HAD family hydrolase [Methanomassiliicoccaceae archaeon]|nr:HAD family hydrolase [Methanomassiliicoccaceae archaeon]
MELNRKYLAVGFDMDSTLLDTNVNYRKLSLVVYDEMRKAGVPENVLKMNGGSIYNMKKGTEYLTQDGRSGDIYAVKKNVSGKMGSIELENVMTAKPYEGAEEMIAYLKNKGYRIGVLTRGSRRYAVKALTVSGIIGMLDALVCRDDFDEDESKPSPIAMRHLANALNVEPKDILYLGDDAIDFFCARDSGAGFIGVLTMNTEEEWRSIDNGIPVIDTVAGLLKMM